MTAARPFQPDGDNCSVDGYRPRPGDEIWEGLDWSRAQWRDRSTLMLFLVGPDAAPEDWHWRVPHPEWETFHRVRKERRRRKPLFAGRTPPSLPATEPQP